ncbi:MAG: heavy-metal-associated domain-containing protein [Wenzhouxiangellaceae bacterium]|nr:heavy-metal-associated domain-containing protein [Wenzhouxiangellaceae bacterium]
MPEFSQPSAGANSDAVDVVSDEKKQAPSSAEPLELAGWRRNDFTQPLTSSPLQALSWNYTRFERGFVMFARLSVLLAALMLSVAALAADNQYLLGVDGLACPFCAYGIEKRLNKIDGVTEIYVDVADSVVRVTLQEGKTLSEEQARQAVNEAGFTLRSYSVAGS